ncbi:Phenoloxidase subunit 1 [Gryllus bimaculatus]|nr:Phenoloxidase subunit 1 [Gryllus bimaculatus]
MGTARLFPLLAALAALAALASARPSKSAVSVRPPRGAPVLRQGRERGRGLQAATQLRGMRTYEDFMSAGTFCRERINPFLFSYAMSVAVLHRNDTRGVQLPLFAGRFPEKFFDGAIFSRAREETNLVNPGERIPLEIPLDWTGTDLDPEHRVAYFREDVGINLNHWAWHLRLLNWREPIEGGYFSKLDSLVASRVWPPRHAGARPSENGEFVRLDEVSGIDLLGNIMEASPPLSVNLNLYGDFHNLAHVALGLMHDPDHRHLETFSVVAEPTTAMRDPLFYRLHSFVDDVFHEHKRTLPPYTVQQLGFDGIRVASAQVQTQGLGRANELNTFWQVSDIDLSRGLDFAPRGPVFVRVTHLQHTPFSYRIQVNPPPQPNSCSQGHSYCGIFNQPYPDRRPMGYPFDRNPRTNAQTLAQFLTPNMFVTPVTIRFFNEIRAPGNSTGIPVRRGRVTTK